MHTGGGLNACREKCRKEDFVPGTTPWAALRCGDLRLGSYVPFSENGVEPKNIFDTSQKKYQLDYRG